MSRYLIAEAIGGVMEKPGFDYIDYDIIEARNEKEALAKYKVKHNSDYWSPECMAKSIFGLVTVINKAVSYEQIEEFKNKKQTAIMISCSVCGSEKSLNCSSLIRIAKIRAKNMEYKSFGHFKKLCLDCRIIAEEELSEFLVNNKYFY